MRKFVISVITDQNDENHNILSAPITAASSNEAVGSLLTQLLDKGFCIKSVKWVEV